MQLQLCSNCVLPVSDNRLKNAETLCSLCSTASRSHPSNIKPDDEKLQQLIAEIRHRGEGKAFDCVVGWSGGRDSTYLLYQLVVEHKLRCAALFGTTPFTPIEIIQNVRSIAASLNIKLKEIQTPAHHTTIARFCLQLYAKTKAPILVNLACASCKYINKEIFRYAHEIKVPTIIYGDNQFEDIRIGPASIDINTETQHGFSTMIKVYLLRIERGFRVLSKNIELLRHILIFFKASVLYVNQYSLYFRLRYPRIVHFEYFHYADWNESAVHAALHKLGWQLPADCTTTWRADCMFDAVKNTVFKQQLGFTYGQALYSSLIRAGKMSREEALQRLAKEEISKPRLLRALKICGLPQYL